MSSRALWHLPTRDRRREIERAMVSANYGTVLVEYSWSRNTGNLQTVVGELIASAHLTSGSTTEVLVVTPANRAARAVAISFAQIYRITLAPVLGVGACLVDAPKDDFDTFYALGMVLAGPERPESPIPA